MTKWVCIDNSPIKFYAGSATIKLVKGEVYEGEYNQIRELIYIKDENGKQFGYATSRFRPLADIREEQIKSIFDD